MTANVQGEKRPTRYAIPNNEPVVLTIGSERLAGTIRTLSITGGAIRLPKEVTPGTFCDLRLNTVSGPCDAAVEVLGMAREKKAQAFHFVQIDAAAQRRLESALDRLKAQGLGDGPPSLIARLKGNVQDLISRAKRA